MSVLQTLRDCGALSKAPIQISLILAFVFICYVVYQRFFHPLAKYPGPLIPSLTNAWKSYWTYNLQLHDKVLALHHQYKSPVVRIGPNDLHFWSPGAIAPIYKAGRSMLKTEFYDAFTTFNPNMFGTRNEQIHAVRRRQLAHVFSLQGIKEMECFVDEQITTMCNRIRVFAQTGETFDLKDMTSRLILDILGEIAFSRSFKSQTTTQSEGVHDAIRDHIMLASVIGQMPYQPVSKFFIANSPIPWIRKLAQSRAGLRALAAQCVHDRLNATAENGVKDRKDLLKSLIDAKDPETGSGLSVLDINTEAYAFIIAGAHTTANTMTLLFWHLFQNKDTCLAQLVSELDKALPELPPPTTATSVNDSVSKDKAQVTVQTGVYPIDGLEENLPYTMSCIRENFRMNAVFTVPLFRRVTALGGAEIDGYNIPQGTNVCIINHVLHHNPSPEVFGADNDVYDPSRWTDEKRAKGKESYLLPFSVGHRMCIGRNLAMMNILKSVTTLFREFEFTPVSAPATATAQGEEAKERAGRRFVSSGVGELEGPLLCKARLRRV